MGRNFLVLLLTTFFIGLIFKYLFSFKELEQNTNQVEIELNIKKVYDILYNDPNLNFDKLLINHLYHLEKFFLNADFDNLSSRNFALGSLYFLRYKEYLAARNLLSEINKNLYFIPRSDKHGEKIPIINYKVNSLTDFNTKLNQYNQYQELISKTYGTNQIIEFDYFNLNPSEYVDLNDKSQGELRIYNPYFFNQKAKKYLNKAKSHLEDFLKESKENDYVFQAQIKYFLLESDKNSMKSFIVDDSINLIIELLNDEYVNRFQIDLVDFLVKAELNEVIKKDEVKKIYKKMNNNSIRTLFKMKRQINNLDLLNNRSIKNINCKDFEDDIMPVELYIAESELIFKNHFANQSDDWVDLADSKINDFWTKCINVYHQIDMEEICDGCLRYNNYGYTLLTSFRLGIWHGGQLPMWNGRFNRVYTKTFDADIVDPSFTRLRDQIDLWMGAIIK